MNTEQLKQETLNGYPDAASPATILALLECVDALRYVQNATHPALDIGKVARAALQKLEDLS